MAPKIAAQQPNVRADSDVYRNLPHDSVRAGAIRVRVDGGHIALARAVAERLSAAVTRAYGRESDRLVHHVFMLEAKEGSSAGAELVSALADSTGRLRMRSGEAADVDAVFLSWSRKVEETIADEIPGLRDWIGGIVPTQAPTENTWNDARIALILSGSSAAHECTDGAILRCKQVLGLVTPSDPAFVFYNAEQRKGVIEGNARILRRADAPQYDRCIGRGSQPACDSLIRQIPVEAVPSPTNPTVRQSLARFAIARGGDGAFERFAREGSPRERIEAAAGMPVDSVVSQWSATLRSSRHGTTALDRSTALSSLAWATLCACLSLRSSRWR
jgi:hypothetical protein